MRGFGGPRWREMSVGTVILVMFVRKKLLVKIPPIITHTPFIFQVLHADTMHMTPKSNGCGHIIYGRCGMTSWMEGKAVRDENGKP